MLHRTVPSLLSVVFVIVLIPGPAPAEVRLPAVFSDHMVLQRQMPVPVWGWASPGEKVTVKLADQQAEATADKDGKWTVKIGPFEAGGPHELTVTGTKTLTIKDVLVGEVWLCSGQSNMAMVVRSCLNAAEDIQAANFPRIRHFRVARGSAYAPQADCRGAWAVCSPKTVSGFTAAGYFFGREVHKELKVPVGLLHSSVGGTPVESWTNRNGLEDNPARAPQIKITPEVLKARTEYAQVLKGWRDGLAASANPRRRRRPPNPPKVLMDLYRHNGRLFNAMIHPLIPYAIRGATWYQGEANAGRGYAYRKRFAGLIQGWRHQWGQGDFPFLFVQLPNYRKRNAQPEDSSWPVLRESQAVTLRLPKTGMAVTIDIGEAGNIHPRNKQDVGRRLALVALAKFYGKEVVHSGPVYEKLAIEGGKVRLHFQHVGGGLTAKGGGLLKGFTVAGADRKWVWAEAAIDGKTVVVHSEQVPKPAAVRYAWAMNPECNLYNAEGLPAAPFRTDDWPVVTQPKPRPAGK